MFGALKPGFRSLAGYS